MVVGDSSRIRVAAAFLCFSAFESGAAVVLPPSLLRGERAGALRAFGLMYAVGVKCTPTCAVSGFSALCPSPGRAGDKSARCIL